MLSLGRYPGQVIVISNGMRVKHLGVIQTRDGDTVVKAVALIGVEAATWSSQYSVEVDDTLALGGSIRVTVLGIGNQWSQQTRPSRHKPADYLRLGIAAPAHVSVHREETLYKRHGRELREAAEAVVATAQGNTYGLSEAEQLEALRGACQALADVLDPPSHIEMPCGAYVEDVEEAKRHSRDCRDCQEVVAEDKADMAHSDGEC